MPTNRRPRPRKPRRRFPPEVLSDAEVRALMDACGVYAVTAQRNRALLAFLYQCGARIGEALEVRPKDLDLDTGVVRLLVTKGGWPRRCSEPTWRPPVRCGSARPAHPRNEPSARRATFSATRRRGPCRRLPRPAGPLRLQARGDGSEPQGVHGPCPALGPEAHDEDVRSRAHARHHRSPCEAAHKRWLCDTRSRLGKSHRHR